MREIEAAGKIPFTAIVNNSNLGGDTVPQDVENTDILAKRLSEISGLPLIFTSAEESVAQKLTLDNILPMKLQKKYFDIN